MARKVTYWITTAIVALMLRQLLLPSSSGIIVCIKKRFHIDERLLRNAKTRVS